MKNKKEYHNLSIKEKYILTAIVVLRENIPVQEIWFFIFELSILQKEVTNAVKKFKNIKWLNSKGKVNESIIEHVLSDAVQSFGNKIFPVLHATLQNKSSSIDIIDSFYIRCELSIWMKDLTSFEKHKKQLEKRISRDYMTMSHIVYNACEFLPNDWILTLPSEILSFFVNDKIPFFLLELKSIPNEWLLKLIAGAKEKTENSYLFRKQLANVRILQGDLHSALSISEEDWQKGKPYALMIKGIHLMLNQQKGLAWKTFLSGINAYSEEFGRAHIEDFYGIFAFSCLLTSAEKNKYQIFNDIIEKIFDIENIYFHLSASLVFLKNEKKDIPDIQVFLLSTDAYEKIPLAHFFQHLFLFWKKGKLLDASSIKNLILLSNKNKYRLIFDVLSEITINSKKNNEPSSESIALANIMNNSNSWESSFDAIVHSLQKKQKNANTTKKEKRLSWFVDASKTYCDIILREQKRRKNGSWTSGRKIEVHLELMHEDDIKIQDKKIIQAICDDNDYYEDYHYYNDYYQDQKENWQEALIALSDHPFVFSEKEPSKKFKIQIETPDLHIQKSDSFFTFTLSHKIPNDEIFYIFENKSFVRIVTFTEKQLEIAQIIGKKLQIPFDQEYKIQEIIKDMHQEFSVISEISEFSNVTKIQGKENIYAHIFPISDDNFCIEFLVKPHGEATFFPGIVEEIATTVDGKKCYVVRDLEKEIKNAEAILNKCDLSFEENWKWNLDIQECLVALEDFHNIKELTIEWPQGEKIKINNSISEEDFYFKLIKQNEWFNINAELKINEQEVWDIKKVLKQLEKGRFIPLEDGVYDVITKKMQKRIEELHRITDKDGNVHNALLPTMQEFLANFDSGEYCAEWQKKIKQINAIQEKKAQIPKAFQATLRKYQEDGFQWLDRLYSWGVGGCLADDMGLGKTIQALALLLKKSNSGPSLVIAPTSVCINWQMEAKKFAPKLQPYVFTSTSSTTILEKFHKNDLVITSYGLLQNRVEDFSEISWNIIILDEAQAIKNIQSKRCQATMQLNGKFRLITTGTPIENNLSELWTLSQFTNPGLLGKYDFFKFNFIFNIEKNNCEKTTKLLRKILSPFILRRTKQEVLQELPPKIEKNLYVQMDKKQLTFYEAVRQRAIERIDELSDKEGQRRIQILAEITRLRRACCHPKLIDPNSDVVSGKMTILEEILDELLPKGGKILIFSQFVQYLQIVKKVIEKRKIKYLYLDGSTPQKKRQVQIDSFQKGEAPLFLISLKAGGVGLNLTEANHVIHLDPWWNPAVEDQATDRAHRIGQKKVVTVHRIITKDTIEEKILELHAAKRNLASKVLEGTNKASTKLDSKLLLNLLTKNSKN